MRLIEVEKVANLDKDTFKEQYLDPQLPVVFTDLISDWPAIHSWTIEHLKSKYGTLQVPIYSNTIISLNKGHLSPNKTMPFGDYLDMISGSEPCELRLFLFNLFKYAPELKDDYKLPGIMDGFYNDFPFLFFGGKSSKVALHYDLDMSHVFLNQISGRKRVILFPPDQSKKIYQLPFTVASNINVNKPDYAKHPALKNVNGYEVILNPGETLFIPTGFWHYMEYLNGGYSISLRANESLKRRLKGAANIAKHYLVDKSMKKLLGKEWQNIKNKLAEKRANAAIEN